MARAKYVVVAALLLLPACSRHPAMDGELEKAAYSCNMAFDHSYGGSSFDRVSIIAVFKKIPRAEFDKRKPCLKRAFFLLRIEAYVANGGDGGGIQI